VKRGGGGGVFHDRESFWVSTLKGKKGEGKKDARLAENLDFSYNFFSKEEGLYQAHGEQGGWGRGGKNMGP